MRWATAAVLAAVALAGGCGSSEGEALPDDVRADLDGALDAAMEEHGVPGATAGVWVPGEDPLVIERGVARIARERPIDAADRMRIGSVTKSFTVTVLLQLAEEGVLSLDDPISDHVPGVENGSATLRRLADMTGGVFNYTEDPRFQQALIGDLTRTWTPAQLVAVADRNEPYFPPGEGWHYSNTGTVLIGMAIERATGRPLAEEIERRVLRPLGLDGTSYPDGPAIEEPFAHGYGVLDPEEGPVDMTATSPTGSAGSGAMVSRLDDLRAWGEALGSGELLDEETQRARLDLVPATGCPTCPEYDGYGLGVGSLDGWVGHTGDYIGYQALVMYEPESGAVAVILVNLKDLTSPAHVPTEVFREWSGTLGGRL